MPVLAENQDGMRLLIDIWSCISSIYYSLFAQGVNAPTIYTFGKNEH